MSAINHELISPITTSCQGLVDGCRRSTPGPAPYFFPPCCCVPLPRFIEPCLPSPAERPPTGPDWVHEIKHDGYRLMARRDPIGIRLLTRNGYDWSPRYPLIVEAVNRLKVRSCLIDGEAVACDANGLAVFEHLRRKPTGRHVLLYAFDLLELDGEDLRRASFETRKATLASLLRGCLPGLRLNEHLAYPGDVVFQHACKMGLEGIVSKRLGSRYRSGRTQRLAQVQEPGGAGGEAGGRGGLGQARVAVTQNKETRPNDPGLSSMDARALEFAGGRPGVNAAGGWRFQALRPRMSGAGGDADGRVKSPDTVRPAADH